MHTRFNRIEQLLAAPPMPAIKNMKLIEKLPLSTVDDLNQFEAKLANESFYQEMLLYLQKVNGAGQYWRSASYKLCNFLFAK